MRVGGEKSKRKLSQHVDIPMKHTHMQYMYILCHQESLSLSHMEYCVCMCVCVHGTCCVFSAVCSVLYGLL